MNNPVLCLTMVVALASCVDREVTYHGSTFAQIKEDLSSAFPPGANREAVREGLVDRGFTIVDESAPARVVARMDSDKAVTTVFGTVLLVATFESGKLASMEIKEHFTGT